MWWPTPVVPATEEAETGELLEPGRLQWAEITPLYSSLGDKAELHLKKINIYVHNGENTITGTRGKEIRSLLYVYIMLLCFISF